MMFGRRRHFEEVLFMGNGDHSGARAFELVALLMDAIEFLSGHQQPAHPTHEEAVEDAKQEFIAGEAELRTKARDLVRALTDREIEFLPRGTRWIHPDADWVAAEKEVEKREAAD